jgi:hypothetical protein
MVESTAVVIRQTTTILPYLNEEVPAIYVADEGPFIPVSAVFRVIGIGSDTYIRRWRNYYEWDTACKLPFQTEKRGRHLVWCLSVTEVPLLYSLFYRMPVSPERRIQLFEAIKAHSDFTAARVSEFIHGENERRYKEIRQTLFSFLSENADIDMQLKEIQKELVPVLDFPSSHILLSQILHAHQLFQQARQHARNALQEMGVLPILDALIRDGNSDVLDSFPLPLSPRLPKNSEYFSAVIRQLVPLLEETYSFIEIMRERLRGEGEIYSYASDWLSRFSSAQGDSI